MYPVSLFDDGMGGASCAAKVNVFPILVNIGCQVNVIPVAFAPAVNPDLNGYAVCRVAVDRAWRLVYRQFRDDMKEQTSGRRPLPIGRMRVFPGRKKQGNRLTSIVDVLKVCLENV
jgi:hypothetical protein